MKIVSNRFGGAVNLLFTSNSIVNIVGSEPVSNIALPGEYVKGAYIKDITVGSISGRNNAWIIKRGSNTVAVLDSTITLDFAGLGDALTLDSNASLIVTLQGNSPGSLLVTLKKEVDLYGDFSPIIINTIYTNTVANTQFNIDVDIINGNPPFTVELNGFPNTVSLAQIDEDEFEIHGIITQEGIY